MRLLEDGSQRLLESGDDRLFEGEGEHVDTVTTNAARNLTLEGLVAVLRRDVEYERALRQVACSVCGEPFEYARGVAHCRFHGAVYPLQ